jgi:hypothetical protein
MSVNIDISKQSLLKPGRATDFFKDRLYRTEAAICAEMARLGYVKERDRLAEFLGRGGFRLVGEPLDEGGTQGFVAQSVSLPSTVVLAFRGTEPDDPMDIIADAKFKKLPWPRQSPTGNVHTGFADALPESLWDRITNILKATPGRLLFTGHSLGAALATLAASLRRPDYLATFGSPLVGDQTFASSLDSIVHDRFVGCRDLVTRVPPREFGYVHTRTLRYIDRNGTVLESADEPTIEADRKTAFHEYLSVALLPGTVALRDLADHAPINYVTALTGSRGAAS